jgi:hypothetical protein
LTSTRPAGWLGEAALGRARFPDGNLQTAGYAWLLAPILQRRRATLSIGYAFSAQDARESRFVLANPSQHVNREVQDSTFSGRFLPYYTPDQVVVHSAIGSLTLHPGPRTSISGNGAWAFRARENTTAFVLGDRRSPAVQAVTFGGASPPGAPGSWSPRSWRTAFPSGSRQNGPGRPSIAASSASLGLTYRFSSAAGRRVDRY